nr:hypothetical protein [Pseudomonadota bacterium]
RIADCITGGKADTPNCGLITQDATKNTTLTACLENPFATACESVPDFTTFALARTNRASFCDDSDNATDDLCKGDNVGIICRFDPFTAICPDATYGTTRQTMCLANTAIDPTCVGAEGIATVFCGANLFSTETACMHTDYDDDRQMACLLSLDANDKCIGEMGIATVFCKANPFDTSAGCTEHPNIGNFQNASCLDVNNNNKHTSCTERASVNHADYLASFGDTLPPATLVEVTTGTDVPSHFVSIGENGVIDGEGLTGQIITNTLRREGDTMDGVTYIAGAIETVSQSFVGLLPTTNLGAPLVEAPMDTTWEGRYSFALLGLTPPITFTVTFGAGDQAGTITAMDSQSIYTTTFTLDFNAEGVITGKVNIDGAGFDDDAQARGLIGEEGLVGGYVNTDGGGLGGNLYGGFVAD